MALWSWPEGVKSLSPGACRANQSSFPFCQSCPASPAENRARGSCLGKRTCHRHSPPGKSEGRAGTRCHSAIASTTKCDHFKHKKGEGLAQASRTHEKPAKSFTSGKAPSLLGPDSARPSIPTLSVQCPVQVSASICQSYFCKSNYTDLKTSQAIGQGDQF